MPIFGQTITPRLVVPASQAAPRLSLPTSITYLGGAAKWGGEYGTHIVATGVTLKAGDYILLLVAYHDGTTADTDSGAWACSHPAVLERPSDLDSSGIGSEWYTSPVADDSGYYIRCLGRIYAATSDATGDIEVNFPQGVYGSEVFLYKIEGGGEIVLDVGSHAGREDAASISWTVGADANSPIITVVSTRAVGDGTPWSPDGGTLDDLLVVGSMHEGRVYRQYAASGQTSIAMLNTSTVGAAALVVVLRAQSGGSSTTVGSTTAGGRPPWPDAWPLPDAQDDPNGLGYIVTGGNGLDWQAARQEFLNLPPYVHCFFQAARSYTEWSDVAGGDPVWDYDYWGGAFGLGQWTGTSLDRSGLRWKSSHLYEALFGQTWNIPVDMPMVICDWATVPWKSIIRDNAISDWPRIASRELFDALGYSPYYVLGRRWARIHKAAGRDPRLTAIDLLPEMTGGKGYRVGPDIDAFKEAWRVIVSEIKQGFADEGLPPMKFVFRPNIYNDYGPTPFTLEHEVLYPGDSWVDFVGVSLHNSSDINTIDGFRSHINGSVSRNANLLRFMDFVRSQTSAFWFWPEWHYYVQGMYIRPELGFPSVWNTAVWGWTKDLLFDPYADITVGAHYYGWWKLKPYTDHWNAARAAFGA